MKVGSVQTGSGLARHETRSSCQRGAGRVFVRLQTEEEEFFYTSAAKGPAVLESVTAASAGRRCRKELFIDAETLSFLLQRKTDWKKKNEAACPCQEAAL